MERIRSALRPVGVRSSRQVFVTLTVMAAGALLGVLAVYVLGIGTESTCDDTYLEQGMPVCVLEPSALGRYFGAAAGAFLGTAALVVARRRQ